MVIRKNKKKDYFIFFTEMFSVWGDCGEHRFLTFSRRSDILQIFIFLSKISFFSFALKCPGFFTSKFKDIHPETSSGKLGSFLGG